jgi:acetoin:2,6-dichlorophenolindophenol oxidoreductase subunit beta
MQRQISYAQAIREAHAQLLESDPRVFVIGQGLWSPWYAGASLLNLEKDFGRSRLIDSPVSENAITGAAVGAAIVGMRPIVFHPRMDFMLLAVDPIVNQAANWSYMFAGRANVPVVIRASINRGGEQGAQHSQALQGMFMHLPGLKVVMPATPADAKGLLIAAVRDGNPVLYIDDRWLYEQTGPVPEEMFEVPIGAASILRKGEDMTIVSSSYMAMQSLRAADVLETLGISAEVVDLRSVKPWDKDAVCASVAHTGRLLVVDGAWPNAGVAAEVAATVAERAWDDLLAPITRLTLPDAPAPTSLALEKVYYLSDADVVAAARQLIEQSTRSGASRTRKKPRHAPV